LKEAHTMPENAQKCGCPVIASNTYTEAEAYINSDSLYIRLTNKDSARFNILLQQIKEYKEILEKLRAANHKHLLEIRDVSFLPEGEIHVRSKDSSPYDMGHDELKYPFERILYAAEVASDMKKESVPELYKFLKDEDNAVRYWGVLGFLIRGEEVTKIGIDQLRKRLNDTSPFVRIAAAECLAKYGSSEDNEKALDVLAELAPTDKNGIMVSMAALTAVGNVGGKAMPLKGLIGNMNPVGFSPDERFNKYVPTRIIPRILEIFSNE